MPDAVPSDGEGRTVSVPLDADGDVHLPTVELLTGRGFITGKSGSGKSNTASVVVEELLDGGFPVLIVDTDGEYWGLKEEYEILHVGADEECDLQVGAEHAEKLASLALEENVPIILDVSGYLDEDEANDLLREIARELFATEKKLNKPFLMLVEEIHEYIPEGGGLDDTGQMLVRIGKRGRKRGLGLVGMSQRPADVKKDFITQCDWLMWHRLTWQNDTNVVRSVVDADTADEVQDLADGEGFLMADFLDADIQRVQVRRKHTFDAGATPDLGEFERPDLKSVSGDLVDELEDITEQEQRRQDRIAELEAELEDREERIDELEEELETARDVSDAAQQFAAAVQGDNGAGSESPENFDEQLAEKNERIHDLEAELSTVREERDDLQDRVADLEREVERLQSVQERVERAELIEDRLEEAREALDIDGATPQSGDASEDVEDLREERDKLRNRVDELEDRLENADGGVAVPSNYRQFVEDEVVDEVIQEAKEEANTSPRYVKGVVAAILQQGGPVDYETVADRLGVSDTSNISKAATTLETLGLIKRVQQSPAEVDFNMKGVEEIKRKRSRQEQTQKIIEDI